MLFFWLVAGILIFLVVSFKGLTEDGGFQIWGYYYLFSGLSFLMFFVRRWMLKRMDKHLKFMEEKRLEEEQ